MLTGLIETAVLQASVMALIMAIAWLAQQRTGNSGWIDVSWVAAVGMTGVASALFAATEATAPARQAAVVALVAAWSLRLAWHIGSRALRTGDDPRYAELIRQWGSNAPKRLLFFAQSQALAGIPLVLAITLAAHRPAAGIDGQDLFGLMIMLTGVLLAAIADRQMQLFSSHPGNRGMVCTTGIWAWSRHPNYFGEWLVWLGVAVVAFDFAWGWLALAAPAWMYWLLVHVSGVPPLEQHMINTRGQVFRDYQRRTSVFFPMPPKSG